MELQHNFYYNHRKYCIYRVNTPFDDDEIRAMKIQTMFSRLKDIPQLFENLKLRRSNGQIEEHNFPSSIGGITYGSCRYIIDDDGQPTLGRTIWATFYVVVDLDLNMIKPVSILSVVKENSEWANNILNEYPLTEEEQFDYESQLPLISNTFEITI